jgi:lysophospholipase L1-like esterase
VSRSAAVSLLLFTLCAWIGLQSGQQVRLSVDLEVSGEAKPPLVAQAFWRETNEGFDEGRSQRRSLTPPSSRVEFDLPLRTTEVRLDPIDQPVPVVIRRVRVATRWGLTLRSWSEDDFQGWAVIGDVGSLDLSAEGLRVVPGGPDPRLKRDLGRESLPLRRAAADLLAALAFGIVGTLVRESLAPRVAAGPPAPRASAREWVLRAVLVTGSTLIGLVVLLGVRALRPIGTADMPWGDIGLRLSLADARGRPLSGRDGDLVLELDPFSAYALAPGQSLGAGHIDEHGLRGGAPPGSRPLAIVLGGSAAFGVGVTSDGETFAARLNGLQSRWRVANAAVPGYLSGQELAHMLQRTDTLDPRVYVVFDGWNDLWLPASAPVAYDRPGFNWQLWSEVEDRLHAYSGRPSVGSRPARRLVVSPESVGRLARQYASNLDAMRILASGRGRHLVVAFQPEIGQKKSLTAAERAMVDGFREVLRKAQPEVTLARLSEAYREMVAAARPVCERPGITCLDMAESPGLTDAAEQLYADPVHLNAAGHRRVAEALAPVLQSLDR